MLSNSGFTVAQNNYQLGQMPEPITVYPLKNPGTLCFFELGSSGAILSIDYEKYLSDAISIRTGFTAIVGALIIVNDNLTHAPVEVRLGCATLALLWEGQDD